MIYRTATIVISLALITTGLFNCSSPKKTTRSTVPVNNPKAPVPSPMEEPAPIVNPKSTAKTDPFLEDLLAKHPNYFQRFLQQRDSFRLQIIYTQIDRKANNKPVFKDYYFNVNPDQYFYPASTVKMPTALLALQKLNELKVDGLDKNTSMITGASYSGQTEVFNDPNSADGRPTIANYVKKIFLVSDNDAFNRLYEFVGQDYLNGRLHSMGWEKTQIIHRLERLLSEEENRRTNPVRFIDASGRTVYEQAMQVNGKPYPQRNDWLGNAYYSRGNLVKGPMDFSKKNRLVLEDLHQMLRSILFPNDVPSKQRFNISTDDYRFVWKYMSQYPAETLYPDYNEFADWDAYCKFLYWGSQKGKLPKTFRIFNKVGDAYGFLIDAAYIVDFEKNIEFMVSAAIYCNTDGVLNDSKYDYDELGFPFLKNLGEVLYKYETTRKREHVPDLSTFRMVYEK